MMDLGWKRDAVKYAIRFGICLLIVVPILIWTQSFQGIKTLLYKLAMSATAVGLAEFVWGAGFKYWTKGMEKKYGGEILVFRGLLYAAIIIGFCVGL